MCYKIVNNLVDVDCERFFKFSDSVSIGYTLVVIPRSCVNHCIGIAGCHRIINIWNALPDNAVASLLFVLR